MKISESVNKAIKKRKKNLIKETLKMIEKNEPVSVRDFFEAGFGNNYSTQIRYRLKNMPDEVSVEACWRVQEYLKQRKVGVSN